MNEVSSKIQMENQLTFLHNKNEQNQNIIKAYSECLECRKS